MTFGKQLAELISLYFDGEWRPEFAEYDRINAIIKKLTKVERHSIMSIGLSVYEGKWTFVANVHHSMSSVSNMVEDIVETMSIELRKVITFYLKTSYTVSTRAATEGREAVVKFGAQRNFRQAKTWLQLLDLIGIPVIKDMDTVKRMCRAWKSAEAEGDVKCFPALLHDIFCLRIYGMLNVMIFNHLFHKIHSSLAAEENRPGQGCLFQSPLFDLPAREILDGLFTVLDLTVHPIPVAEASQDKRSASPPRAVA